MENLLKFLATLFATHMGDDKSLLREELFGSRKPSVSLVVNLSLGRKAKSVQVRRLRFRTKRRSAALSAVDDSQFSRKLLEHAPQTSSRSESRKGGREALAFHVEFRPNILSPLDVAGFVGSGVCRKIRSESNGSILM